MHLTARPSRFAFLYDAVGVQHRNVDTAVFILSKYK